MEEGRRRKRTEKGSRQDALVLFKEVAEEDFSRLACGEQIATSSYTGTGAEPRADTWWF